MSGMRLRGISRWITQTNYFSFWSAPCFSLLVSLGTVSTILHQANPGHSLRFPFDCWGTLLYAKIRGKNRKFGEIGYYE